MRTFTRIHDKLADKVTGLQAGFWHNLPSLQRVRIVAAVAVLVSVAFTASMGEVINRDGITYILTARAFLEGGISAAMAVYNWPAYPILFALISHWTSLTLETSAHLVNTGCMLLLVDSFVRLSNRLEGPSARPWIAALVVLTFPPLSHRLEIYRDWGYLALAMAAFLPLLSFWQDERGRLRDALLWQGLMLASMLFRIEAIAIIALVPLTLLWSSAPWQIRLRKLILASSWLIPATIAGVALLTLSHTPTGKLAELVTYTNPNTVFAQFNDTAQLVAAGLNKYSDDFAGLILAGGLITMAGWMTLDNLGGFLLLVTLYGLFVHGRPTSSGYRLVYWLLSITALTLLTFLATKLITVSRYAMLASLLVMLTTSAFIGRLEQDAHRGRVGAKWIWRFVFTGLIIGSLITITALPDYKSYVRVAGNWIQRNVAPGTTLITNDSLINYYSNRPLGPQIDSLPKVQAEMRDTSPPYYVALRLKDRQVGDALTRIGLEPVAKFHSTRADEGLLVFYAAPPKQ